MQPIEQALEEIRALHEQLMQSPAPDVTPQMFQPFPPGADPIAYAIQEVARLKQAVGQAGTCEVGPLETGAPGADAPEADGPTVDWVPRACVYSGESGAKVVLEIPGVARDDVSVTVVAGELIVYGERKPARVNERLKPVVVELSCGTFERRFPLPSWCTPDGISAGCVDGVLEIDLTRRDRADVDEARIQIG